MEADVAGVDFKVSDIYDFYFPSVEFLVLSALNCFLLVINTGRQITLIICLEKREQTNSEVTPTKLSVSMTNVAGYLLSLSNLNTANSI
jgi:hypothetical protein